MTCVLIGGKRKYDVCIGQLCNIISVSCSFCKAQLFEIFADRCMCLTVYFHPKHAGVEVGMRVLYKSGFKSNGPHPCRSSLHNFIDPLCQAILVGSIPIAMTTRTTRHSRSATASGKVPAPKEFDRGWSKLAKGPLVRDFLSLESVTGTLTFIFVTPLYSFCLTDCLYSC